MTAVWLMRYVTVTSDTSDLVLRGSFCRAALLPIPPFPGLGLPLDADGDPHEVTSVDISYNGAVVVEFGPVKYRDDNDEEARSMFGYLTGGWLRIRDGLQRYYLEPPTGPFEPIHPPRRGPRFEEPSTPPTASGSPAE